MMQKIIIRIIIRKIPCGINITVMVVAAISGWRNSGVMVRLEV